ncbi:hypothetical protein ALC57_00676 [Trachymyrmex cornetzi]|uniref:Uncharacterized protein n=1 Tax=Trachymyrmex cornetzi TaxID=471704 RepID=A0A151JR87_9HYME|nr:hypothetical protein ALC57_00676 [Trachymyrmex cornetzi]
MVRFTPKAGASTIVSFRDSDYSILKKSMQEKNLDVAAEKIRILETAASIIRNDIMRQVCDTDSYPSSDEFLEDVNADIPESLQYLVDKIVLQNKKGSLDSYRVKCTSVCHAIMSAVRPRSFLSPLTVMLHRKFAFKKIIDILNHLGVCCSYAEACHYQDCTTLNCQLRFKPETFCQFVFDNADFNTNTIDGANTFHSMGGIRVITPANSVEKRERVQ